MMAIVAKGDAMNTDDLQRVFASESEGRAEERVPFDACCGVAALVEPFTTTP